MSIFCNPLNVPYPYQFKRDPRDAYRLSVNREVADPSLVLYQGKYYLFASMTGAVWVAEDLAHSPNKHNNFPLYRCQIYRLWFRAVLGFGVFRHLTRLIGLVSDFCSSAQDFASSFL